MKTSSYLYETNGMKVLKFLKKKFLKRFDRMKTSSYLYETNEEDGVVKIPLFFPYRKEFKN
jgi:hypothetical protein